MIINRDLAAQVTLLAQQFPIVAIMGPRQSGKTTLVKEVFPHYEYVTLEDLDREITQQNHSQAYLVYAGSTAHEYKHAGVIPWNNIASLQTNLLG